jgi:HK97 family phage major capsid protein
MPETKALEIADIKSAIDEGVKPLKEGVEATKTAVKAVEDRIAKIEALPFTKIGMPNLNAIPTQYRGYKLNHQATAVRSLAAKSPREFDVFADEEKMNGFCKWMISAVKALKGDAKAQSELSEMATKAQNTEGTSAYGGYLVPQEYDMNIIALARAKSFALQECNVIPMNRDIMNIPKELANVTVAWTAETVAATETEPTFSTLQLDSARLDGYGKVTNELLNDADFDIVGFLTETFAYAIGQELDNQVLNGTGSPVSGVLTAKAGYSVVLTAPANNFSSILGSDLSNMVAQLNSGDVANAKFIIGRTVMHYIRSMKASTSGVYVFADIGGTVGGTIWGFPYIVSENVTNTTGVSTAFGVFGDFKKFYIGRRIGAMTLDLDPYGLFTSYGTQFRMITRWALGVGRTTAFCRGVTAAT